MQSLLDYSLHREDSGVHELQVVLGVDVDPDLTHRAAVLNNTGSLPFHKNAHQP